MHENQRIVNDMIAMAKEKLSNLNDKDFTRSEIFDFIEDIVLAGGRDNKIDEVFEKWSKK